MTLLRKRILTILQLLLFLGLGIFIVWWMARGIDSNGWTQIRESLSRANYWLFVPVLVILVLSHYVRALRWKILMEPLGYQPSTFNVFNAVMIGYMANLAFPRLGEVLKCTILARYEKTGPDKLIGTIVAERAVDLVCLLSIFVLTVLVQIDTVGAYAAGLLQQIWKGANEQFSWLRLLVAVGLLVLLFVTIVWFFRRYSHLKPVQAVKGVVKGIWSGLISIRYIRNKGAFILYSVLIWTLYYAGTRIGFYALQEVSHLGARETLSILSFGSIGMIVTQGGLGAYQYAVQETLVLYDIPRVMGFIYGWILWIAQTGVILLGGLFSLVVLPVINQKKDRPVK
ncbi:MAG TPA: lysylphosphatidylglycerol synthase transmembrane domain-containing protein [Lacibacter sp.]|nr:lysylphosphatidylglycerol synthase transmembrane domain-containing protein [Lacibacter sp.]HMO89803.1 lysylphosphatidylglycerol synthase transmembrane domain-containing protein [Lacibacter sp.]HMP86474.1 lysylphosphatidylglycerol synthase transmembrane domain-containing protein [Lacibacter sp.]